MYGNIATLLVIHTEFHKVALRCGRDIKVQRCNLMVCFWVAGAGYKSVYIFRLDSISPF
jgi:hypothetical protein